MKCAPGAPADSIDKYIGASSSCTFFNGLPKPMAQVTPRLFRWRCEQSSTSYSHFRSKISRKSLSRNYFVGSRVVRFAQSPAMSADTINALVDLRDTHPETSGDLLYRQRSFVWSPAQAGQH